MKQETSEALKDRFEAMGGDKEAMADALIFIYKDMAMDIESKNKAIELAEDSEKKLISQKKAIVQTWWFRLFASKKIKDDVFGGTAYKDMRDEWLVRKTVDVSRIYSDIKEYIRSWHEARFMPAKEAKESKVARKINGSLLDIPKQK